MPPNLTPESGLPLVAAGQAAFSAVLLAARRDGDRTANRLLAVLFAIFALNMGKVAVYASGALAGLPHLARITFPLELLYGPLFWAFTRVSVGYPLTRRDMVHLTPAILTLAVLLPFYLQTGDAKLAVMQAAQRHRSPADWLLWLANWGTLSAYLAATAWTLRAHSVRVRDELSSIGPESLRWLQRLTAAMITAQLVEIVFVAVAGMSGRSLDSPFLNTLALLAISSTVAVLALQQPALRFRQPDVTDAMLAEALINAHAVIPPLAPDPIGVGAQRPATPALLLRPVQQREEKYARSGLTERDVTQLAARLESHMQTSRAWRDGDLSLTELARQLQVPSHHLSRALNDVLQQSFFDYVNRWRVTEVQRLLSEPANASRSILELAFAAGFNSKSSFNACFKQATGSTPRAYRSTQQSTDDTALARRASG
jgi:AraC-like DNA-binding protein